MSSTQQLLLGEGAGGAAPVYIEDVFSTYLYTGNSSGGSTTAVTNNIDLSTKGGLVWIKQRDAGTYDTFGHVLVDTVRGRTKVLQSNNTSAEQTITDAVSSFNTNGFTAGFSGYTNNLDDTYVSWTFREQPKFFDIVTYTGNGVSGRQIAHSLGSVPGCMIVKCLSIAEGGTVYHRSEGATKFGLLYDADPFAASLDRWNNTTPTSTVFTVGDAAKVNGSGQTYVAYLFAHDAGGFGLTGTDNVISCGTFTGAGATTPVTVNIGFEPQWILAKQTSGTGGSWSIVDNMRGFVATTNGNVLLYPNTIGVDDTGNYIPGQPTSTGFKGLWTSGQTFIYVAIRRGPMKVPTLGTSVYNGVNDNSGLINVGFVPDLALVNTKAQWDRNPAYARLTGQKALRTNATSVEDSATVYWDATTGYFEQTNTGGTPMSWFFGRAPGYFDVVCYTETGSDQVQPHNLGVVPELIIQKPRTSAVNWIVNFNFTATTQNLAKLNLTTAANINITYVSAGQMTAAPTATNVNLATAFVTNATVIMYLFATLAGVSKVGSYTGTGALQTVNCGFTSGARFVMIKRTDSTGDWYVWDSARGISSGNDPYLLMNSVAAEVTNTNYVDTTSVGFQVTAAAPAEINANGGSYFFLAIA